jgi:hypothetical protein
MRCVKLYLVMAVFVIGISSEYASAAISPGNTVSEDDYYTSTITTYPGEVLLFPSGARSLGMGEVGTALANDEDALFYNAAGLGVVNSRWSGGAGTYFYEQLLPSFKIDDLFHRHIAGYYQFPGEQSNGIAIDYNFISLGTQYLISETGISLGQCHSYEGALSAGWGCNLKKLGLKDHSIGVALKYLFSVNAYNGETIDTLNNFAMDIGYLWQFYPGAKFGATLQNIGPDVKVASCDTSIALPLVLNMALAYTGEILRDDSVSIFAYAGEIRAEKELAQNSDRKVQWNIGGEATFFNTASLRTGILFDRSGTRYEWHMGAGLRVYNHFQLDGYFIRSPEGFMKKISGSEGSSGFRDGQIGISLTLFRLFSWNPGDATWWKKQ